ncbi:MAG: VWA domain-containing protein [Candidatus Korarchaeota archaeon NZ13-K]|nr:MAG: VWA domain-containing protein [Candidatus Korarchaeota archaeon NZ13-K]
MTLKLKNMGFQIQRDFQSLNFENLRKLADHYLMEGDLRGLLDLSNYSQILVAESISEGGFPEKALISIERDPETAVRLYRQVRWKLNERAREIFRRLISKVVIRASCGDVKGLTTESRDYVPYSPGMEFDLERTIERIIERCKRIEEVDYDDIVASTKSRRNRSLVIILDSSGSMTGKKILIAMMIAAIASHKLREGRYCVIGFNSDAFVMKSPTDNKSVTKVIEEILDLVPLGYTNIAEGLRRGLELSRHLRDPDFLLITDGEYNVGEDPRNVARRFRSLNVIYTAGRRGSKGLALCESMASLGGGRCFTVRDFREIPGMMRRIFGH